MAMTEMVMRGERGCPPPDVISDDALLSPVAYDFDSFVLQPLILSSSVVSNFVLPSVIVICDYVLRYFCSVCDFVVVGFVIFVV
ncbi:hypothetical protein RHGRI_004473 [Rhododendron griersonianum]|uniref:Uncharacterized protein n=1 Tax=Rhododendron griersonianum TaxID=479676 RepID=A0AAV6L926_9ERIC|nr:hypothetical protein RHGRI_004473 [Rhododendron griersonianum]